MRNIPSSTSPNEDLSFGFVPGSNRNVISWFRAIAVGFGRHIDFLHSLGSLWMLLRRTRVPLQFLCVSTVMSVAQTFTNLYIFSLYFPLIHGLITFDFSRVQHSPGFGKVIQTFPDAFDTPTSLFLLIVLSIFLLSLLKDLCMYLSTECIHRQAAIASNKVRSFIFDRYLAFGKLYFDNHRMGELKSLLVSSSSTTTLLLTSLHDLFVNVLSLSIYFSVMLWISWELSLAVLLIFPVVTFLTQILRKKVKQASIEHSKVHIQLGNSLMDILSSISLVKGYAQENKIRNQFHEISEMEIAKLRRTSSLRSLMRIIEDVGTTSGFLLVSFAILIIALIGAKIPAAQLFLFVYIAQKVVPCLNALNTFTLNIAAAAGPIKKIEEIFSNDEKFIQKDGEKIFAGLRDGIEFRHVHFAYSAEKVALRDVSFHLKNRKKTALIGKTGAGKTTIGNLLLRLYDCPPGTIFIDGTDIREYKTKSLLDHMAFVSQDITLFDESIRENICFVQEDVPHEKLIEVAKRARIYDFIQTLPDGFETQVGERGLQLSGGERQRIAIARALIKNAEILILDEATSSLDNETEKLVTEAIIDVTADKTVLVIAHRLSTIRNCDNVVVLDGGRVIEQGTFEELSKSNGDFYAFLKGEN